MSKPHAGSNLSRGQTIWPLGQQALYLGLTAILLAYFLPWLPHPAAGLRLIGLEMAEWVKFLPEVQAGQITPSRHLFYWPPITISLSLTLISWGWSPRRYQTWLMRGLTFGISLLALPGLEIIRDEPLPEWGLPISWIGLVGLALLLTSWLSNWQSQSRHRIIWLLITLIGSLNFILPTWAYLAFRPTISLAIGLPLGIGVGVWVNGLGSLGITAVGLHQSLLGKASWGLTAATQQPNSNA